MAAQSLDVGHAGCRDVLKLAAERLGWEVALHHGGTCVWVDSERDASERLGRLRRGQWLSWIAGVQEACGKVALAEALQARGAVFWPRSWRVPQVSTEVICEEAFRGNSSSGTLIVKPDLGSQGSGISLAQSQQELGRVVKQLPPEGGIVQEYIDRPLLLDGFKWDARIYVLAFPHPGGGWACFLAGEGLVRVCSEPYQQPTAANLQQSMVHLTNYSLNKYSDKYAHNSDPTDASHGCKRTLSAVLRRLEEQTESGFSAQAIWQALGQLSRETVEAVVAQLPDARDDRRDRCFHLLGLDILLDEAGRPWLLEANHRPSLLVDEIHPLACGQSREEVNRLFAAEKRNSTAGPRWGRPCRCSLHPSPHTHQPCAIDVAAKLLAVQGALQIVEKAKEGREVNSWAEGTGYTLV
mmetsp:Transcript_145805/g.257168  ORF Transcript_145805/g.257168 Transcript_145805/m.257168 type:complete len:410 (+) Transcript_145805:33-1262(+)